MSGDSVAVQDWSRFAPQNQSFPVGARIEVDPTRCFGADLASVSNAPVLSVDVSHQVIEAFMEGSDSADVSALDLYEVIIKDQSAKIRVSEATAERLRGAVSGLRSELTNVKLELVVANTERDRLLAEIQAAPAGGSVAPDDIYERYVSVSEALGAAQASVTELEAKLAQAQSDLSKAETATDDLKAQLIEASIQAGGHISKIESLTADIESLKATHANLMAAQRGKHKEAIAALEREAKASAKAFEKLGRERDVQAAELKKLSAIVKSNKQGAAETLETLKTAVRVRKDMEQEIAVLRKDRRYLTMMMDCIIHEDFFVCDEGGASIFSMQTVGLSSPDSDFVIDENYPVALWLSSNGFACVMGVSLPKEDGDRDLVMPMVAGLTDDVKSAICPPAKHIDAIIEKMMEFHVPTCNEAVRRSRQVISGLATIAESDENLQLSNKDLIAISARRPVATHGPGKRANRKRRK